MNVTASQLLFDPFVKNLLKSKDAFKCQIIPSDYLYFIYLFSNHLLSAYYVPRTMLDTRDTADFFKELTVKQGDALINQ